MTAKVILAFCIQGLLQCAYSQCLSRSPAGLLGCDGSLFGAGCGYGALSSTGGGFPVTSISPMPPTGITVISENSIEGPLIVSGNLPFLSAVAVEGVLPTAGSGGVSYGCGNGEISFVSEYPISTGIVGPSTYGPAIPSAAAYGSALAPGLGYGPGLLGAPASHRAAGLGCGRRAFY